MTEAEQNAPRIQRYQEEVTRYRAIQAEESAKGNTAEALEASYQATRRISFIAVLSGSNDILKDCIELNKNKPKPAKQTKVLVNERPSQRAYQLAGCGTGRVGSRGVMGAMEQIMQHKGERKRMPEQIKWK